MHRLLLVLFFTTSVFAAAPTLVVNDDGGNTALELSEVAIKITMRGHLARTEFELTYRSSLDRDSGGEFRFPLPPDAEVSDLGLYFNGRLRHGVAVERVLARTAYDEVVHMNIDPALVEWSAGRDFKLNVYPIPARGEKKVFLAYDQELTRDDYTLDVSWRDSVKSFHIDYDIEGAPLREENGVLRIVRDDRQTAFAAKSSEDGLWYASAAIDVEPARRDAVPAPHTVIFYDTSASSIDHDGALLRRFLAGLLAKQQAWSTAVVVPFHIDVDEPRRIENAGTPAGARELERVLDDLQPLGATNLMAVASRLPKMVAALPPSTRIVLVTDGLTSLGNSRTVAATVAKLGALNRPVLVVHAAKNVNDTLLANAARATGGWAVDLLRTDVDVAIETAMHLPASVRLNGPEVMPASVLASEQTRFAIAARSRDVLTTLRDLPLRELYSDVEASMVRRAWARAKLRELLATGASDDDLIAHGQRFTQVTPRTSLLVLDRWWDYERYGIPMPPDVLEAKDEEEKKHAEEQALRQYAHKLAMKPSVCTPGEWRISGRVLLDGYVLPGATMILLDGDKPIAATYSDGQGWYELAAPTAPLHPSVVADLVGLTPERCTLDQLGMVPNIEMEVGPITEAIVVTAEAPVVEVMYAAAMSALRTRVLSDDALVDPALAEAAIRQRRELRATVIERMRSISSNAERLRYYLSARKLLGGDKGFHVFAAEIFRDRSPELAARVLSDLAEARPEDAPLLRILGRVLDGWGAESLARLMLERAIEIAPNEPQSWREIILLEARHGRANAVASWSKRLQATKRDNWRMEAVYEQTNDALARWEKASFLDRQTGVELRAAETDDLTVELMYDTGWSHVALHVTEPSGERVAWDHDCSASGATFTGAYTWGYGPVIYTLPRAPKGTYELALDYRSDDTTTVTAEALVHVIVHRRGERSEFFFVVSEVRENFEFTRIGM